ncbi:hypothetical protein [Niallia circulans]|uniref:hypothetical protein n=1 Tax=Niallia circulans TaxID=1397 RepID=UPI000AE2CA8B|nr:hypothetical protein [Niallia circulans]
MRNDRIIKQREYTKTAGDCQILEAKLKRHKRKPAESEVHSCWRLAAIKLCGKSTSKH